MSDELPPLPDDLAFLRDVEPPSPPPGFEDAVATRLATSWAAAGLASAAAPVASGLSLAKALTGGVALLLTGVGVGVAVDRTFFPPAPVEIRVEVPVPTPVLVPAAPEPAPPPEVDVPPPPVTPTTPVVQRPRAGTAPSVDASVGAGPEATRDLSLSAERALLEVARSALARGDLPGAFGALERHTRDFPQGRLEEEREALFIKALHAAGRTTEAAERTTRFQQKFPESLLAP